MVQDHVGHDVQCFRSFRSGDRGAEVAAFDVGVDMTEYA